MEIQQKQDEGNANIQRNEQYKGKFGYFCFTPSWLQWLDNPWIFLLGITGLMFGQAFAVLGILTIMMPQIEKRFNFSGFDVGMIAAANDVPAVIFGLIISHYGNFGNKVKLIGFGGIVTGIGFIIFTIPHYIIEKYNPLPPSFPGLFCFPPPPTIAPVANTTVEPPTCDEGYIADWYYLALLLIGQFIAGAGTVPLYTFPPMCFEESVSKRFMPLFLGLWQGAAFAGPMIAFGVSQPLLEQFVNIDQPDGLNLTPDSYNWIGNWWLGFLIAAACSVVSAFFILGFPSHIAGAKYRLEQNQKMGSEMSTVDNLTAKEKLRDLWCALKEILTNWTFVFNCLGLNCNLLIAEGLAPFIAKILILQYGVSLAAIGNTLTIAGAPPLILGVLGGSFLVMMFNLEDSGRRSAFICFVVQIFSVAGVFAFLIPGCNEINLAGWETPYGARGFGKNFTEHPAISGVPLGSTCNQPCGCHLGIALPVCGSDDVTYLSPCYAGCSAILSLEPQKQKFANCSCIASKDGFGGKAEVKHFGCDRDCKNWLGFIVMISCLVFLTFFSQISPSKIVVLRCVPRDRISFAFGVQYMSMKIISHIPGPILFGHVVDQSCAIWQTVCDKTGYCWIYDLHDMRITILIICAILAGLGVVFYFLSWVVYKEPENSITTDQVNPNGGIHADNPGYQNDVMVDETKM